MASLTDQEWLALGALTESNRPHEWPYVMQVMLNRLNGKGWPKTIIGVLRQPKQFSAFNEHADKSDLDCFLALAAKQPKDLFALARTCGYNALARPRFEALLDPATYFYWSPQSMLPVGRPPSWAANIYTFTVPAIDPNRFIFGMAVSDKHPLRGRGAKTYDFQTA